MMHKLLITIDGLKSPSQVDGIVKAIQCLTDRPIKHEVINTDPTSNRVIDLETLQVYRNPAAAARAIGADRGNMSKHLRGALETIKGKRFRYER